MDDPTFNVEASPEHGLESIGPFDVHKLRLDGYRVPQLTGRLVNGVWHFCLDERFGCEVPEAYGQGVAWMIANALAIGAGYSCFGENSRIANPFKCRMHGITLASDIDLPEISEAAS